MAQVTIYLDEPTAAAMRRAAAMAGVSVSRWIAALVQEHTATQWPAELLALEGAWPDDGPRRCSPEGEDVPRETW